ncbi:hypothetical protein [Rhizobium leguminosarum]|uniref:hypothetical protein n=1 Tax=Rhizobium leguminosarum TaxID=384 RepID=UPI0014410405|nr:hypothetical protein [Rhizobium leguminosarum]NKL95954.1 hypothetical protein [Rhizobium leguminosarum bv. viciae]
MKSWTAAFDEIKRRTPDKVRTSVRVERPFFFDPLTSLSEVPDFIEASWESIEAESNRILNFPGRDANFTQDTLICATKFYHVLESVRSHVARGAMTWSFVDAYHAALVSTRLLGALYGIFSYTVKGRTILMDYRPELGSVDEERRFQKAYRDVAEPTRILKPVTQLSQKDSWSLCVRLANITPEVEGVDWPAVKRVKTVAADKVSSFRNGILYDAVAWGNLNDFGSGGTAAELRKGILEASAEPHTLTISALTAMFDLINPCFVAFCHEVGVDPLVISPLTAKSASAEQIFLP